MVEDSQEGRQNLIQWFPRLSSDNLFEIRSRRTPAYNCIAWAMRIPSVWVQPGRRPGHWWPLNAPSNMMDTSLVRAFRCLGFEKCPDDSLEFLYDKVVLYRNLGFWTHAARVVGNGKYHSKMGTLWDITHRSGDVFVGTEYGECYCFMKRPKYKRYISIFARFGLI